MSVLKLVVRRAEPARRCSTAECSLRGSIQPMSMRPCKEHPRFRHLKKRGSDVRRQEFVGVRWLAADMNIAPEDTLGEVEPIVTSPQVSIRGLVLTLKFSEWGVANRVARIYRARARLGISRCPDAATRFRRARNLSWSRCVARLCDGWAVSDSR